MLGKYVFLVIMLYDLTLPLNDDTILIPGGGNAFKAETILSIEQGHAAAAGGGNGGAGGAAAGLGALLRAPPLPTLLRRGAGYD